MQEHDESAQKRIADKMGLSWDQYARRAERGVQMKGIRWEDERKYPYLRFKWLGIPCAPGRPAALATLRYDRSTYPLVSFIEEEDRHVGLFPLIAYEQYACYRSSVDYVAGDVARVSVGLWKWRAVLAVFAIREPWRRKRFGLELMSQVGSGHWSGLTWLQSN